MVCIYVQTSTARLGLPAEVPGKQSEGAGSSQVWWALGMEPLFFPVQDQCEPVDVRRKGGEEARII